jgi:predicted glycosyltransferase
MTTRPRILFFVFDGTGLGHLQRTARIAHELQGPATTLVMTGMREASRIVGNQSEVVILPKRNHWRPGHTESIAADPIFSRVRAEVMFSIVREYNPDALCVDYLPFGKHNELRRVINSIDCKKYLIHRGIVDTSDYPLLGGEAAIAIGNTYHRILVAADDRIVDVAADGHYSEASIAKVKYAGYVTPPPVDRDAIRACFDIPNGKLWVVCAGGGGLHAEGLLNQCEEVAKIFPDVYFDIVHGPFSGVKPILRHLSTSCRIHPETEALPMMQACADVVISTGGYNTLTEGFSGGARLLVYPSRTGSDDEQTRQVAAISRFYPVRLVPSLDQLALMLADTLGLCIRELRPRFTLSANGAQTIAKVIMNDLQR